MFQVSCFKNMPNWLYIVTHTFYLLGLTIWIGGGVILGALVAPALFRSLPRPQAGGINRLDIFS